MSQLPKAVKREKKRENNRKMVVSGRSIFTLVRAREKRIKNKLTTNK